MACIGHGAHHHLQLTVTPYVGRAELHIVQAFIAQDRIEVATIARSDGQGVHATVPRIVQHHQLGLHFTQLGRYRTRTVQGPHMPDLHRCPEQQGVRELGSILR